MAKVSDPKSPSRPTVKRLFALSGNRCAFPDCQTRLVDRHTGSIVGEVCHIKGEKPTAPRYDQSQDNHSRHSFDNLILMCNVHHKIIDDNGNEFTVERLNSLKESHETRQDGKDALDDAISEQFTVSAMNVFANDGDVVHASHVSGGQVAHTITNNYGPQPELEEVKVEGQTTLSAGTEYGGCPHLLLTIVCRSGRPAKIRRAMLSLIDQGIMASFQAGFGDSLGYSPLPGSNEELTVDLIAIQKPNSDGGFVLQRDDVARFIFPVNTIPIGLFLIRPAAAMSIKVGFFDESEVVVIDGDVLKHQLETLCEIAMNAPCNVEFAPTKMQVKVKSIAKPDLSSSGKVNPNPIHFGLQIGSPVPSQSAEFREAEPQPPWFKRLGAEVAYPGAYQGRLPQCVYAAIAGGINYLAQGDVWTAETLYAEHQKNGAKAADVSVAATAIQPVSDEIEYLHHNKESATQSLTPELIRDWISAESVVILSMELRNDSVSQQGGWHMFTLMARDGDLFQVWDTNGLKGFLSPEEIRSGFFYPNGWFFMPHDKEEAIVLKRKINDGK